MSATSQSNIHRLIISYIVLQQESLNTIHLCVLRVAINLKSKTKEHKPDIYPSPKIYKTTIYPSSVAAERAMVKDNWWVEKLICIKIYHIWYMIYNGQRQLVSWKALSFKQTIFVSRYSNSNVLLQANCITTQIFNFLESQQEKHSNTSPAGYSIRIVIKILKIKYWKICRLLPWFIFH